MNENDVCVILESDTGILEKNKSECSDQVESNLRPSNY